MKDMKIKHRLIISFTLVSIAMMILSIIGSITLAVLGHTINLYSNKVQGSVSLMSEIRTNFECAQKEMFRGLGSERASTIADATQSAQESAQEVRDALQELKTVYLGNEKDVSTLEEIISRADVYFLDIMTAMGDSSVNQQQLWKTVEKEFTAVLDEMDAQIEAMMTLTSNYGTSTLNEMTTVINITRVALPTVGGLMLLVAFVLATRTTKAIVPPLEEMERVAAQMAEGKLDIQLAYKSDNECGHLAHSMREMSRTLQAYIESIDNRMYDFAKGNLNTKDSVIYKGDFVGIGESIDKAATAVSRTMAQIRDASEQVASGADQVAAGANASSQGATQQASSVQELAATINEISSQVKENAESANHAHVQVQEVSEEMTNSNQKMQDMIQAMQEITNSSNEIGKIIKTIEDIAFQTNILALNAAVEAARAGAAGKGFAVVADEVRNLASKSSEASKSTAELIERSLQAVQNGMMIADDTAQALSQTVESADQVAQSIAKISSASNDQAIAITQITQGIEQISSVVQTSSATAEQSAAASQQLSGQAVTLKRLVDGFSLKDDEESAFHPMAESSQPMVHTPAASFDEQGKY